MQNFWKNFWFLIKPYWTSDQKWIAGFLLFGMIFFNILQVRLMVILNSWQQGFYDSLQAFDKQYILLSLLEFVIILILAIIIFTYGSYLNNLLINRWRKWMTHEYISQWLNQHTAYSMQMLRQKMDNPDQRISQDLNELPVLVLSLFSGLFNAVLTFVSFSFILWKLSGNFTLSLGGHVLIIPGYMFWITIIYAGIGTWIIQKIGKNLAALNYQQEQFNANFRFSLVRVRESAEQIALYQGQETEVQNLKQIFEPVFKNFMGIITLQKYLGFFVNGYNLMIQVVGILIALPRYISEKLALGYLMQVSNAFGRVVDALSFVVSSFGDIASLRAVVWRLAEFNLRMTEAAQETNHEDTAKNIIYINHKNNYINIKNLKLYFPAVEENTENTDQKNILSFPLTIQILKSQRVLITGAYGSGKSLLLKALAGIWPYGEGIIEMPQEKKLFLPQKPYFPLGTLKQGLLYPDDINNNILNTKIHEILEALGLNYFKIYLDQIRDWSKEFSLGEQQLIAFARIFLIQPEWVFLDEATSALDEETEYKIYDLLTRTFPAMSIISVGHRSSLKQFHQQEIYIQKQKK